MVKIIAGLLICLLLSGCVLHKTSVIQMRGEKLEGVVWNYIPVKGEDVVLTWIREIFFTDEKDRKLPPLLQMYLDDKGAAGLKEKEKEK